jgi:hypothetical protein
MPREVVYALNSYHGLGKILTYSVVKDYNGEIIDVDFDAFQHGRIPCMVFLKREDERIACYSLNVKWKGSYSKALRLSDVECLVRGGEDYEDYMEKVMVYTKIPSTTVKKKLYVEEVVPKGDYIMGLFGGQTKRGAKKYAGLVFSIVGEYDRTAGQYAVRLSGTASSVRMSKYFLDDYWKKLIYRGEVFPFHLSSVYNVLLSSEGAEKLKDFLKKHIMDTVLEEDKIKVKSLIEEFKQPEKPRLLEKDMHYVIYRCTRNFASVVLSPKEIQEYSENGAYGIVVESHCSFISTDNEQKAYYYSAILNYLAYKVIERKATFERDQFLRPLIAILHAGLEWKGKRWQSRVAELGKKLHQEAPKCFASFIKKGMRVEDCFERLKTCYETKGLFENLARTINENVNEKRLYESLEFVSKINKT